MSRWESAEQEPCYGFEGRATCGVCGSAFERRADGKVRCEWCPIPESIEDERPTAPIAPETMDAVVWERRR